MTPVIARPDEAAITPTDRVRTRAARPTADRALTFLKPGRRAANHPQQDRPCNGQTVTSCPAANPNHRRRRLPRPGAEAMALIH